MGRRSTHTEIPEPALPDAAPTVRLAARTDEAPPAREICEPVTIIGSRRDCGLFVRAGEVSKLHCALVNTGRDIVAVDLCSRSGTFVNDERLTAPRVLAKSDALRVGPVPIEFEILAGETAPAAQPPEPPALRLRSDEAAFETATLPAVIGRRAACDIVLDTPDVSLAHALLLLLDGKLAIADLGSRSGTVLNGQRINLAWLRDGDTLLIGGETLTVHWSGPQFESAPATAETAEPAATEIGAPPPLAATGFDDLGAMLDGLKARIAASQEKLRRRAAELDEREAELERRIAEFEARQAAFADERERLEQDAAEMKHALAGLARREQQVEQARAALETQRAQLDEQQARCEEQKEQYENQISRLMEREAALHDQQAALDEARAALEQRTAEVARREQEVAQAAARIEQFRQALQQARNAFELDAPGETAAGADPESEPATARPEASQPSPEASEATTGGDGASELPAPLVDEPLFAGTQPPAQAELPEEVRERLRTLRRTTGRTEAELLPQVMAEYEAQRLRPPEPQHKGKKKRRRWLS